MQGNYTTIQNQYSHTVCSATCKMDAELNLATQLSTPDFQDLLASMGDCTTKVFEKHSGEKSPKSKERKGKQSGEKSPKSKERKGKRSGEKSPKSKEQKRKH
jgi:uncharacterized membrane protein YukC